jgi:hypothetical protein
MTNTCKSVICAYNFGPKMGGVGVGTGGGGAGDTGGAGGALGTGRLGLTGGGGQLAIECPRFLLVRTARVTATSSAAPPKRVSM